LRNVLCAGLIGLVFIFPARAANDQAVARGDWRWHLTGVIIGPQLHEALFGTENETRVVELGAQLDGWTLTDIRPSGVTLRKRDEEKRLGADEWMPDDARAADELRRLQQFEAARAASGALEQQRQDQANAESALGKATAEMQRAKQP
jgi:hypothetical protein